MQITSADPSTSTRILVIDDEKGVREGCRRVLQDDQVAVDIAEDAFAGLDLLKQTDYDLVYVDVKMPGMDGLEFLSAAHELPVESVFVVITAFATLDMAVEATKRGAYDFVAKPFTPDELITMTRRALERARLVRERNRLYEERDRRLLELATEKGRLRSIVEAMRDGVIVTNREGQVVLHNAAAAAFTGCRAPEGGPTPLADCGYPPDLVALIEEASGQPEVELRSREISVGPEAHEVVEASAAPVTDAEERCLGVVTVLHDVSELKKVELVKAQFINMVAHELRAPLAAVDSQVQAILQGYVKDVQKQFELLDRSHARLRALLELVNDLLVISRSDAGTTVREIRALDLGAIAREVGALMEEAAREHGVTISVEVQEPMPPIEADAQEMSAIFSNLISNAIKYNRPQGKVAVRVLAEPPYAVIEVSDTGVGISEEGLRRIFDEFYREKTDATRMVVGTGLGLAIVRRIISSYHGDIRVESQLGVRSVFTVRLPLTQATGGTH
ncbi:response regulator [bacterium]|nr:response regulator [bacterium]